MSADTVNYRVARCFGGYNVHGLTYDGTYTGRLVYECLHLHPDIKKAWACKRALQRTEAA